MREGAADARYQLALSALKGGYPPALSEETGDTCERANYKVKWLFQGAVLLVGVGPFLLVHLPITFLGAAIGVWLFYVQHQFEDTFWDHDENWNFHEAALRGSSHYDLPQVLRWFTANIGVHHVHHLCSPIPYYRLPRVLLDHPQLAAVGRLTRLESVKCLRMALWNEEQRRGVSFRQMHAARSSSTIPS